MPDIVSDSSVSFYKLLTAKFAVNHFDIVDILSDSDIMFPAAGDGCFYVGLGGKNKFPSASYEPYQCCPNKPSRGTKVPKMSPAPVAKQVTAKSTRPSVADKPFQTARKDAKIPKSPPPKQVQAKASPKQPANVKEGKEKPIAKPEKGKGKKGFFGTGKYIWWW